MNILKYILDDLKIERLRILVFFDDQLPGALLDIDGRRGDYRVLEIYDLDAIQDLEYDGGVIGSLKPIIKALESDRHLILKIFGFLLRKKIKIKGLRAILKFAKLLNRCGIYA
ncbi:MAG: hypothetical protein ACTSWN_10295 [Promethearchaeota archaeon]